MRSQTLKIMLVCFLGLSSCTTGSPAAQGKTESAPAVSSSLPMESNVLNTAMGELMIDSARFTNEVNGQKPGVDQKILLVVLSKTGAEKLEPGNFSLEEFQAMIQDPSKGRIYILGNDGSETISTMAGWIGPDYKEFAMGFMLPGSATSYELFWLDNDPITDHSNKLMYSTMDRIGCSCMNPLYIN